MGATITHRASTLALPPEGAGKTSRLLLRIVLMLAAACLLVPPAVVLSAQEPPAAGAAQREDVEAEAEIEDDSGRDWMTLDLFQVPDGFDIITLIDGTVYEIEKLEPRPLPKMAPGDELVIRLRNFVPTDNTVRWSNVESVKYFEDLLLEKGDLLRQQRKYSEAYEHYRLVDRVSPNWVGLAERQQQLLVENAVWEIEHVQPARALALAEELKGLNAEHPALAGIVERLVPLLATQPFESGNYRGGRWWLARVGQSFAGHATLGEWRERYQSQARNLLAQALERERAGQLSEATRLAREAAVAWPDVAGLRGNLERLARSYPRLVVAVADLPRRVGIWPETAAERRAASLIHLPMVEIASLDEGGRYQSRLFESIEPRDLGRALTLRLRPELITRDPRSSITANDVAGTLIARAQPTNAHSDPRWRDMLREVRLEGLGEVTLNFLRPPVNPEAWLAEYVQPSGLADGGGNEGRGSDSASTAPPDVSPGLGPFQVEAIDPQEIRYSARQNSGSGGPRLREVLERRMEAIRALDALVHGEVDLIARISPAAARKLREQRSVQVRRLQAPEMHVIAFNFDRRELRSHTLRRALMYGIDRPRLLEETVLGGPADRANALVEGPFPRESYATIPGLEPVAYNPLLARGLVEATRKEFDGHLPSLTLAYSPTVGHRELCEQLQQNWQDIGLKIELVEQGGNAMGESPPDLIYRTYPVLDPVRQAPEIVMGFRGATVEDFPTMVSPWLSSLLVDLERAEHWLAAREILRSMHRAIRDQSVLIPLWQVEVLFAHRTELSGLGDAPLSLYQDVENWDLQPVIPD